jgi:hypothetical protein
MLIDAAFLERAGLASEPNGEVQTTFSIVGGQRYTTVFVANLAADYTISLAQLGYAPGSVVVAVEANASSTAPQFQLVDASTPLAVKACHKYDFQLYTLSPVLPNGMAFLGERTKWVPVNNARVTDVTSEAVAGGSATVTAKATGPPGETVSVSDAVSIRSAQCRILTAAVACWWCIAAAQLLFAKPSASKFATVTLTFDESETQLFEATL